MPRARISRQRQKPHECQIYVLFDEHGSVNYVGRTSRPIKVRMKEHKQVLGSRPVFQIVDLCSTDCRAVERKWIAHYREQGCTLRNINYGQGPHFLSEEGRKKLSLAFMGRPVTWGDKISATQKGIAKNWSAAGIEKQKATRFKPGESSWERCSEEQKERIRESSRSSWRNPELRARMLVKIEPGNAKHWSATKRSEVCEKIRRALLARPAEERRRVASAGGAASRYIAHPELASSEVKKFWVELRKEPARYREYIDRRVKAILLAKAQKKLERLKASVAE